MEQSPTIEYQINKARRTKKESLLAFLALLLIILIGAAAVLLIYRYVEQRNEPPKTYYDFQLQRWRAVLKQKPKDPGVHTNIGYIYLKMGKDSRALSYFNRALELEPKYVPALYNKGMHLKDTGDKEQAIIYLKKAAKNAVVENKYLALFSLGEIYRDNKEYDRALTYFIQAKEDNALIWNVYEELGRLYERKGNDGEALTNYETALKFNPDNESLKNKVEELKNGKPASD